MAKKRQNLPGRILSGTGTAMILCIIALCSLLVLPGIFGYHMYDILSGSMEPTMPVGSLIYVKEGKPEEVAEQDIIAFYSSLEGSGIITHRVVNNNIVSGTFQTKGDANAKEDPTLVSYDAYIGSVVRIIPRMGRVLTCMTSSYGKIAAACVVLLGVVLNLIEPRVCSKIEQRQKYPGS